MTDAEKVAWQGGYDAALNHGERIPPYPYCHTNMQRYWGDGYAAGLEELDSDSSKDPSMTEQPIGKALDQYVAPKMRKIDLGRILGYGAIAAVVVIILCGLACPPRDPNARTAAPSPALRKHADGETEAGAQVSPACASAALFGQLRPLYNAIRQVESSGDDHAIGDDGASRGPYGTKRIWWADACKAGGVNWDYDTHVWDRARCEYLMYWYWHRYCPEALASLDFETLARVHNGGPAGARKRCTADYWQRVRKELER